ncbi:MAG: hypothetical protein HZA50_00980 [Planctomycetes bacterium]|nr:hypothetical protein [Planctomycetota bacterium]
MTQLPPEDNPNIICITREQAMSHHVDDMLNRQASLRGEGITRGSKGKWYYQNWFTFMIAGMVAAFAAWAMLEPYFDDMLYIQGPIEQLSTGTSRPPIHKSQGKEQMEIKIDLQGPVRVNGQDIFVFPGVTKFLYSDGRKAPLDMNAIGKDQVVGLYVSHESVAQFGVNIALFIVPDPAPNPPKKASMTLETLSAQTNAAGMVLFAVAAAMIGLAIGAVDGIGCHLLRRALVAGGIGLVVGFIGGFISGILAGVVYSPLNALAMKQEGDSAAGLTTFGFLVQMGGRSLGWCLAGMAMGLGQGIALRSSRLLIYGFLGGVIGGLLGGLLFDPIDLLLLGADKPSAHWSRLVGIVVVGGSVGAMIGVVELLARDAWLRMVEGPLAGKEFLIFKDTMHLGSSPRSEIYLFNDNDVAIQHGVIRSIGNNYEIENLCRERPLRINSIPVTRTRLRHGDQIVIGRTIFVFQRRKG